MLCLLLAVVPRLFLIFDGTPNHYDGPAILHAFFGWIAEGHYVPSRHPGSPLYEAFAGLVEVLSRPFHSDGIILLCFISSLCVGIALFFIGRILVRYLSLGETWLVLTVFNFSAQEYVIGAAVSDTNFLMCFGSIALYEFLEGREMAALFFACLATASRIQGLALLLPISLLIVWKDIERRHWKAAFTKALLAGLGLSLVLAPALSYWGLQSLTRTITFLSFPAIRKRGASSFGR